MRLSTTVFTIIAGFVSALGARAEPSAPPSETREPGITLDALPGVYRVGVPGFSAPRITGAASVGYGFTEARAGDPGPHHRVMGSLAVGGAIWSFLELGVRMDVRHDRHADDELGSDAGTIVDPGALLRLGGQVGGGVHLGAEGRLVLPGGARTDAGIASSFDARVLAAYAGVQDWVFAASGGYRPGLSGEILDEAARMRRGDRLALGLSEFDAVLVGLGAVTRLSKSELFGEISWDILIGGGAPPVDRSPFRATLGIRYPVEERIKLLGAADIAPLGRAASAPGDPLVPIDPRFSIQLGVLVAFERSPRADLPEATGPAHVPAEPIAKTPPPAAPVPEAEAPPPTAALRVVVVDRGGHPISDAAVLIRSLDAAENERFDATVPLKELNVYEISELPPGKVELTVRADLLKEHTETISLTADQPNTVNVTLEPAASIGGQLRGVVRSYAGAGLPAVITIQPGDKTVTCNAAGEFEVELAPGAYTVKIEAEGYAPQQRKLRIKEKSVTVLNADLQKIR